jgi:hypothetical protein
MASGIDAISIGSPLTASPPSTSPQLHQISPKSFPARAHSSSISSVHFAPSLPRRLASTGSAYAYDAAIPLPRSATDSLISPPKTPAPTPRPTISPPGDPPHVSQSGPRAGSGSVLTHGKRASVVTGGYESSSSDDVGGDLRPARRRATTIAFGTSTPPMSRSASERSMERDSKTQRLPNSRHSSRDILRSTFRPVHPAPSNPPLRMPSSRSGLTSSSPVPKSKRSQSPSRQLPPIVTSSPDSSRSRKGKERAEPRRDLFATSLGIAGGSMGATLTAGTSCSPIIADRRPNQ